MTGPKRNAKDVGADSPAHGSAKEQGISGARGGPQGEQGEGIGRQPAQTSGRRAAKHEHSPQQRKSFDEQSDPDQQGEGEPAPEQIRERSNLQGIDS